MKFYNQKISILLIFIGLFFGCDTQQEGIELTFKVNLSKSLDKIQHPNSVGIIGVAPFLDRFEPLRMDPTSDADIYQKSFIVPDSLAGRNMRFRFVVDSTFLENARFGWRHLIIPDESTVLPLADFNDLAGSTGAFIEPSPAIPVLWADTKEEENYFDQAFRGITIDGQPLENLFSIESTDVSTKPIRTAVEKFLASLTEEQKESCTFPLESDEWRRWHNIEIYERQGIPLFEMTEKQRELAFGILRSSLSEKGVRKAKDIMVMEDYLKQLSIQIGHLNKEGIARLGSDKYYFTFLGDPSEIEPWGWQIDGHHLVINFFVLGDQVVMTPTFMGSEPNYIKEGPNAGLRTFEEEENKGLHFYNSLEETQKKKATLWHEKKYNFSQAEAFRDNEIIPYSGIQADQLGDKEKELLIDLIEEYVGRMKDEHAEVKMEEVLAHINETWFCWVGGSSEESPFYYRIQSPVIMIEFDHHEPVFIREKGKSSPGPVKWHVHTVVRTPNGNDYGKDLLRQHIENHHHD